MQVLTLEKNRGYLIAGIGAIVALFAFIFLPILSISSASSFFSITSNSSGQSSSLLNVSDIAQYQISIWIEGLAAVTAITIAALIAFRPVPFSMLKTTAPLEIQIRWGNYLLILAGIFGVLTPLLITLTLDSFAKTFGANASFASGGWLCLLGMIAVVVGGVLALRAMNTVPQSVVGTGTYSQYPPAAQPQPWSAPVDPYASAVPPQQWDAGQQVPPVQMQQWNTGQTGQPTLPSQQQWNAGQQVPPVQQPQWNTGPQVPPVQQQQWNTGPQVPPTQQQQWNAGQQVPPMQQQQWNTGPQVPPTQQQQPPSGPPYQ